MVLLCQKKEKEKRVNMKYPQLLPFMEEEELRKKLISLKRKTNRRRNVNNILSTREQGGNALKIPDRMKKK